jgi:repressor LexA
LSRSIVVAARRAGPEPYLLAAISRFRRPAGHHKGRTMDLFENLTEKQQAVYEFIRDKIRSRGYGPTVREIGQQFDIVSPNGVVCHLKALEKKGLITREANLSRAIQLAMEPIEERSLPLAGRIAAGVLHEAIEQDERVDFEELFDPADKDLFVLEVDGESMIEDQIADGDFVVVRRQKSARKGQIVVAITDEGEATLKRWYPEKNRIRLEPANSSMKPIYVRNAKVLGVVVGVVRKVE